MSTRDEPAANWRDPVFVQVDMRTPQMITNPAEAISFLTHDWQGSRRKHEFAREICAAALLHHVSSEAAREAFLEAAEDARITVCAPQSQP